MQAIVHFAVGLTGGLLVLVFVDWTQSREFLFTFASGVWALLPDGHWMLSAFGIDGLAAAWRSVHMTPLVNAFWFHHFLDTHETGHDNLEAGASLLLLFVVVALYYLSNDWDAE